MNLTLRGVNLFLNLFKSRSLHFEANHLLFLDWTWVSLVFTRLFNFLYKGNSDKILSFLMLVKLVLMLRQDLSILIGLKSLRIRDIEYDYRDKVVTIESLVILG